LPAEVHLWTQALDLTPQEVQRFCELLSDDERMRAGRFPFDRHRDRFIVARGRLREILAGYLNTEPKHIVFRYGEKEKPETAGLKFNVSHSAGLAVYAITRDREIGVDVEEIRTAIAQEQIAERFFCSNEVCSIRTAPAEEQALAFFRCWTRKEAYIKALGVGLSIPLSSFDVSSGIIGRWSIRSLDLPSPYVGAVCTEGDDYSIIFR
jgi:4'-phosphopantetheinyl transferase